MCVCVSVCLCMMAPRQEKMAPRKENPRKDGIKMNRQNIKMVIKASSFEPRWYQSFQIEETSSRHHKIVTK